MEEQKKRNRIILSAIYVAVLSFLVGWFLQPLLPDLRASVSEMVILILVLVTLLVIVRITYAQDWYLVVLGILLGIVFGFINEFNAAQLANQLNVPFLFVFTIFLVQGR